MAAPTPTQAAGVRAVYRELLRAVDRHLTSVAGNRQWREYLGQEFRAPISQEQSLDRQLQLARDYSFLVQNIAYHRASWPANLKAPADKHADVLFVAQVDDRSYSLAFIGAGAAGPV